MILHRTRTRRNGLKMLKKVKTMKGFRTNKWIHCCILLFLFGFVFQYFPKVPIHASTNPNEMEHSGGFIIKAKKVEGSMDLLGALLGKIEIGAGQIEELEIFKSLGFEGDENIHITIQSPGPVAVKNLKSETLGGSLPEFTGLCLPSQLGWLCLENVTMVVPWQMVEEIDLPQAKITTCFSNECPHGQSFAIQNADHESRQQLIQEILNVLETDPDKEQLIEAFFIEEREHVTSTDDFLKHLLAYLKGDAGITGEDDEDKDEEEKNGESPAATKDDEDSLPPEENGSSDDDRSAPSDGKGDSSDEESEDSEGSEEDNTREAPPPINRNLSQGQPRFMKIVV